MNLVREEASIWSKSQGNRPVRSSSETFMQLVNNLKGMSVQDARQLIRGAIYDDGAIDESATQIPSRSLCTRKLIACVVGQRNVAYSQIKFATL